MSPPRNEPEPDWEQANRERIAAAVVELITTRGYEMMTVEQIVALAGVERARFDELYASKEDCFLQVWRAKVLENYHRTAAAFDSHEAWPDRMRAAAYAMLQILTDDPIRTRFLALGVTASGVVPHAWVDTEIQRYVDFVDAGRQELEDPDSMTRSVAEGVVGAIFGVIVDRARRGQLTEGSRLVPELLYLAMRPYLGEERAREELNRSAEDGPPGGNGSAP